MEKKKLLLVFIHGFQGDDTTFLTFPKDLSASLALALPHLTIEALVYPPFETRGDLDGTVRRFTDWLTTTVIDMEVARGTKSPMVEEGVRVIIGGHSMGGLVGAECLLGLVSEMGALVGGSGGEGARSAAQAGEEDVRMGKEDAMRRREREHTPGTGGGEDVEMETSMEPHMFPYVQGLLAFDTPYLGISPGVVAHGAEGHWNTGKAWYDSAAGLFTSVQGMRGIGKDGTSAASPGQQEKKSDRAGESAPIPPQPPVAASSKPNPNPKDANSNSNTPNTPNTPPNTNNWSKYALYGLGASALGLAAGTTAYLARSTLSTGYSWATSHLEFVGTLGRPEELRRRFAAVAALGALEQGGGDATSARAGASGHGKAPFVGFANFYTLLGAGAAPPPADQQQQQQQQQPIPRNEWTENVLGPERTFCNVPKQGRAPALDVKAGSGPRRPAEGVWRVALNELAPDEVSAHCAMFDPEGNLG